jgi:hypothetical protein
MFDGELALGHFPGCARNEASNGAARSLDLALQNHAHNKSIICAVVPLKGISIYLPTVDLPFSFKLERLRYELLRGLSFVTL